MLDARAACCITVGVLAVPLSLSFPEKKRADGKGKGSP
jgi:hypothetical protein